MLKAVNVNGIKGGKQKLANMKKLVFHVIRATDLGNMQHLASCQRLVC